MDGSSVTELGIGGIFAVLVIRMVLDFVGKQRRSLAKTEDRSGDKDPAYWVEQFREIVRAETRPQFEALEERMKDNRALMGKILDRMDASRPR